MWKSKAKKNNKNLSQIKINNKIKNQFNNKKRKRKK